MPVALDKRGQKEAAAILDETHHALLAVHAKSKKRLARGGKQPTTYIVGWPI